MKTMYAALLAWAAACPVLAADPAPVEPGIHLSWSFGAAAHEAPPTLSLGLYPNVLGWQRLWSDLGVRELGSVVERPAVVELRWSQAADLRLMGLPLNASTLGLHADGDSEGSSFLKPALIVLAAGAAAALTIAAAGSAAEDALEDEDPFPDGGGSGGGNGNSITGVGSGGIACINGDCVVPCDSTSVKSCDDDNG